MKLRLDSKPFDALYFIVIPLSGKAAKHMGNRNYRSNEKLDLAISNLKDGLDPEILAVLVTEGLKESLREIAPTHLKEKLCLRQDRILWMKFELNISKRAVPYLMQAIEEVHRDDALFY